jgi:hypothetical protein
VTSRDIAGPQIVDLFLKYSGPQPPVSEEKTPTEGESIICFKCYYLNIFPSICVYFGEKVSHQVYF